MPHHLISLSPYNRLASEIEDAFTVKCTTPQIKYFSRGEIEVNLESTPQFHKDDTVTIICHNSDSVNNDIMQLCLTSNKITKSVKQIVAIIPLLYYARQHNTTESPFCLNLLHAAGINHIITLDLHGAIYRKYLPPDKHTPAIHNVLTTDFFIKHITSSSSYHQEIKERRLLIVAPDNGATQRATLIANTLRTKVIYLHKTRINGTTTVNLQQYTTQHNKSTNTPATIQNKTCIIIDDMVDSGDTIVAAAHALLEAGASKIIAYVTHAASNRYYNNVIKTTAISKLYVCHTANSKNNNSNKITFLDINSFFAQEINNIYHTQRICN